MAMPRNYKWFIVLFLLTIATIGVLILALTKGEISIPVFKLWDVFNSGGDALEFTILNQIRLPRVVLGFSIGGALSLAGVILQGIYRNPLVEPYTLGISGGASLGVALAILLGWYNLIGVVVLPVMGFIGSMVTVLIVYILSLRHGKLNIQNMLLIGVMVSFIASSGMMFIMSIGTTESINSIVFWIMGSLDETNPILIKIASYSALAGLILTYMFVQPLNALRLGQEKARHLGINTDIAIQCLFVIASVLTGMSVAVAGVIGFVGLVIPHLIRQWVGGDFRILIISSFLAGGCFVVLSDTIARTIISPNELPVGVITGLIGGIVFIVVLANQNAKR